MPGFTRALILGRVGQPDGLTKAHRVGSERLRAGFPPGDEQTDSVGYLLFPKALQQESREVLGNQGIAVPGP